MPGGAAPLRGRSTWMIVAFALALSAGVLFGVARSRSVARAPASSPAVERSLASAAPEPAASIASDDHHLRDVTQLVARSRGNPRLLVEAFAAWAADSQALPARRIVLGELCLQPEPMVRVAALLAAVQASPLALEADPLTREVVSAISSVWVGPDVRKGRDLMLTEARPRARQVVIASVVELALSDRAATLGAADRAGLTSDFIDLYPRAPSAQRGDVLQAVRKLGGNDTAELLQGHGLGESTLPSHIQYRRDFAAATQRLAIPPAP